LVGVGAGTGKRVCWWGWRDRGLGGGRASRCRCGVGDIPPTKFESCVLSAETVTGDSASGSFDSEL